MTKYNGPTKMTTQGVLTSYKYNRTALATKEIKDAPVEIRAAFLEQCDLKSLREIRLGSKHWYDLATIEIFRRSSAEAIAAQKFILYQQLSSYINPNPKYPSKFVLSPQAHAELRSIYFAKNKNTRSADSGLTALMAAAVLHFDYEKNEQLTPAQENKLKQDILLAALDESACEHTVLALIFAFGKDQVSNMGIIALENILDGHYGENGAYLEHPAFETIRYLAPYLEETQYRSLFDNLMKILVREDYESCRLASTAFAAIAADIPDHMVKPVVFYLQTAMHKQDYNYNYLSVNLIIRPICLLAPRLAAEDFADLLGREQQRLTHEMTRNNNILATVTAINNLQKIAATASKEQLQHARAILYNVVLSALEFVQTNPLQSHSCGILLTLIPYKLFSTDEYDRFWDMLFDLIRRKDTDETSLKDFFHLLCAVANEASPTKFNEIILILRSIIKSTDRNYRALQSYVLPELQILAPRMSEAQIRHLISDYELLLDKTKYQELAVAAISYLASRLPQAVLENTATMLQHHLLNTQANAVLLQHPAGLFSTEQPGHQEAFFICKQLRSIVYSIPREQAPALLDTLIARMTDPDVRVRLLASETASILFLRFPVNDAQIVDRIMAAFLNGLTDTEPANRAQTIKIFITLAPCLPAQQLSAIIDVILKEQLLGDPDEAVHQAAAEFFLVFAKNVPAENLITAHNQLYESHQRYGYRAQFAEEGISYETKDTHKADDALVALTLHMTADQLNNFIQNVALPILAINTLNQQRQNDDEIDSAWIRGVSLNISLLDTMIALIKRSPEIPLMNNLVNAFYHKMDANNQVDVRNRAKMGFLELILHHMPEADLPLYVPGFLERANFEDDGYLIEAINRLIPRLPNDQLEMLIAPLHAKLQEALQNDGPVPSKFCEAIFAISRRIPAQKIVPNEIWDNDNHRVKFPLAFQLFFNEYQQTARALAAQTQTNSPGQAQKHSADDDPNENAADAKRQRLF